MTTDPIIHGVPMRLRLFTLVALLAVGLALAACGGGAVGTPSASASVAPASASPGDGSASGDPQILPLFISSEITKGQTRFVFSLTDRANQPVAAPDVPVHMEFYDVAAAPDAVAFEADARFLWAIEGQKGLYVADLDFPAAGRWGVRFTARFPDGTSRQVRADFDVAETGSTPAIGAPVVPLDTPTVTGAGANLATVTTDTKPDARFYETSVAQALAAGKPFVLVFATPAFCQTAICGPTLDTVKAVARDYPNLTFINVEPYKMVMADGRLQPALDASGQLQAATWTDAWGLRSEPWVFVVGADGTMAAKFEGTLGADELRAALDLLPPAPASSPDASPSSPAGDATGIVIAVDQASVTTVRSFILRTKDGQELVFSVGKIDLSGDAFPANHLREHMALAEPVNVEYRTEGTDRVAFRLTDAQ
jgi:hypothetical protein